MKGKIVYCFDPEKNSLLVKNRGISFEEIISILENIGPVDVVIHSNTKKYPKQEMYVMEIDSYIYLVPFVKDKNKVFLKTIFPSRKATKRYLSKR
ncbi:MAG: toxin [Rickettsiella sp.]|nr:toxin [Rickettsiella sp.]